MTVKTGQAWSGLVVTKDATGALATPSAGPAGVLYVDGVSNAATVTVSGSNPYKWTVTLPSLTAGQCVSMYITATIATIATAGVVAEDVADTKLVSDLTAALTAQETANAVNNLAPVGVAAPGSQAAQLAAIVEDTGTTLPAAIAVIDSNVDTLVAVDTSTTDATTAGAISRRRGNSWIIPLTIGAITGYTSLWFTVKSNYDDADTAALVQVKLNASTLLDGLLYVNGAAASNDALGSITVSDATTGAIVVAVDETITDDLAPGEYYYDVQTLIAGDVATPDSGTFTVTADVTRSVT